MFSDELLTHANRFFDPKDSSDDAIIVSAFVLENLSMKHIDPPGIIILLQTTYRRTFRFSNQYLGVILAAFSGIAIAGYENIGCNPYLVGLGYTRPLYAYMAVMIVLSILYFRLFSANARKLYHQRKMLRRITAALEDLARYDFTEKPANLYCNKEE